MRNRSALALVCVSILGACFPAYSFDLPAEDPGAAGQGGSDVADGGAGGTQLSGEDGSNVGGSEAGGNVGLAGTAGVAGNSQAGAAGSAVVLDSFDGDGSLGSGWSGDTGSFAVKGGALEIKASGVVTWGQSFGVAQEAFFSLMALPAGGSVGLVLKDQNGKCNRLEILYTPGAVTVRWCKNNKTGQSGVIAATLAPGDVLKARYTEDERVQVYRGEELLDSVLVSDWSGTENGGRIGVIAEGLSGAVLDNFGGN